MLTTAHNSVRILALIPDANTRTLAVAVSGGADSMALALLTAAAFPGRVHAFTVDHGLREESAGEAALVNAWLSKHDIPHTTLVWQGQKPATNIQAEARSARYRLLAEACAEIGATVLLTAHHKEDQAETVLLRLARGAGLPGLSAMKPVRRLNAGFDTLLVRPLLDVSREDLRGYLTAQNQPWIEDPSNQDQRFDRIKVRTLLADPPLPGLTVDSLVQTAEALGSAHRALDAWAHEKVAQHMRWDNTGKIVLVARLQLAQWPQELARRVLLTGLLAASGGTVPPRRADMLRLMADVVRDEFKAATLAGVMLSADGPDLVMIREPRAISHVVKLGFGSQTIIWDGRYRITVAGAPEGCHVAALGETGRLAILNRLPEKISVPLAQSQPALWHGKTAITVPTLNVLSVDAPSMIASFISFTCR